MSNHLFSYKIFIVFIREKKNTMIVCSECKDSFLSHEIFLKHLLLSYDSMTAFPCGEQSCSKIYASLRSLRKHITSKHTENLESPNDEGVTDVQPILTLEEDFESNRDTSPHDSNSDTNDDDEPSLNEIDENLFTGIHWSNVNTDDFIKYAAKLHSYADVPRTRVENIINDTKVLVDNMMKGIKYNVEKAFDSHNNKQEILEKIEQALEIESSKFSTISSEWHCFKNF